MELILWRHAEAADGVPDEARELTRKGKRQALAMAQWLKPRLPRGALVISSPAKRCTQTAAALGGFEEVRALSVGASAKDVLRAVGWPGAAGPIVVVGHQPTLGEVAALVMTGAERDWRVKKGGVWWLSGSDHEGHVETMLRAVLSPDLA